MTRAITKTSDGWPLEVCWLFDVSCNFKCSSVAMNCGPPEGRSGLTYLQIPGTEVVHANSRKVAHSEVILRRALLPSESEICREIPASPVLHRSGGRPEPVKSASRNVALGWSDRIPAFRSLRFQGVGCLGFRDLPRARFVGIEPETAAWHTDRARSIFPGSVPCGLKLAS
jgi:hypothetical protein